MAKKLSDDQIVIYAGKRLRPEAVQRYREGSRRWKAQNAEHCAAYAAVRTMSGTCSNCRGPIALKANGHTCLSCTRSQIHERRLSIEAMWADGLSAVEIAAFLDWSVNHLSSEMAKMRRLGYDLPYRRAQARAAS